MPPASKAAFGAVKVWPAGGEARREMNLLDRIAGPGYRHPRLGVVS
jgi:hypothetical protein